MEIVPELYYTCELKQICRAQSENQNERIQIAKHIGFVVFLNPKDI